MIEIIPTVVPQSRADVAQAIALYAPFARMLHIDFADGRFAPNITWMIDTSPIGGIEWEAHLMVADPHELGKRCVEAGASRIIGHVEASGQRTPEILDEWRNEGAQEVGLALLAQTPIQALDEFANQCDFAMIMCIQRIGVQGLPFDENAPVRVEELHRLHPSLPIEVDGSVNDTTISRLAHAGATRFCAGSVLSKATDPASTYRALLAQAESALQ